MTEERGRYRVTRYDPRQTIEVEALRVADDPDTNAWLAQAIKTLLAHEPDQALRDAERLYKIMKARADSD